MYFDQFSQEKSPIIICGCPRSGTTALVDLFKKNGYLITNECSTLALRSSGLSTEEYFLEKQKLYCSQRRIGKVYLKVTVHHLQKWVGMENLTLHMQCTLARK